MSLKKTVSKSDIFTIALGSIIGWGAFVLPGNKFLPEFGVINTLIGFTIGIILIIIIEKSYEIMINKYPSAGGEYLYTKNTLSNRTGFITGWFLLLAYISIIPLNATSVPLVLERILGYDSFGFLYTIEGFKVYFSDILISVPIILIFGLFNIYGFQGIKKFQKYIVFILIGGVFLIGLVSLFYLNGGTVYKSNLSSNIIKVNWSLIVKIIVFAPWAFVGFDNIPQMVEEVNFDRKKISRYAILSIVFGGLVYNILNFATAVGVNNSELSQAWPTGLASKIFLGDIGLYILGLALFVAVLSGLNGFFMSSSRLFYAMSKDLIPKSKLSIISSNKNIPKNAILFIMITSCLVPFMGRDALFWFVDLSSVGASVAYTLTALSAFKASNTLKQKVLSSLGIVSGGIFLLFLLIPFWGASIGRMPWIVLIIWVILGMVISFKFIKLRSK